MALRTLFTGPLLLGFLVLISIDCRAVYCADITAGEDAVILEESSEVEILSHEEARVRYLCRTQILTQRGAEENGVVDIPYTPWESIRSLSASVVSPQGKKSEVKKQYIADRALFASFELYSDSKARTIAFPGAVPGSILEYSFEMEVRNLFFVPRTMELQSLTAVRSRSMTVTAPADFPLRISVHGGSPDYTRTEQGGRVTHRWQVKNVPAFKREPDMPPMEDVVGVVSVTPKEVVWEGSHIDASGWDGIAGWDWSLARERMTPTPEISQLARELTAEAKEPMEKARRLYEFVQGKVNYVAISLGVGGWQPHAAADVLKHRYGDCKDKAALLIAMLRSVGLQGYPVLVKTRDDGLIDRDDPAPFWFNHMIAAIPTDDGYLFMDPTSEKTPFRDLPYTDQGIPVLVVKEDGRGDLTETPLFPPERNKTHRLVTAYINTAGDLTGNYIIEYWGQASVEMAYQLESKPTEQADFLADLMSWLCPGAVLKAHEIALPKNPDDPLRVTIRFEVPRFVNRAGSFEIVSPYLVRFPGLTRITAYSGRRTPVFFEYLFSITSEVRLRLPAGKVLKKVPSDRESKGPGLSAVTRYELSRDGDSQVLIVKRSVSVSQREIPVADYQALREFLSVLSQEESKAVTLESGSPTATSSLDGREPIATAPTRPSSGSPSAR